MKKIKKEKIRKLNYHRHVTLRNGGAICQHQKLGKSWDKGLNGLLDHQKPTKIRLQEYSNGTVGKPVQTEKKKVDKDRKRPRNGQT